MTPHEMKALSLWAVKGELGVFLGSFAWVNSTDSAIRPVETEVQSRRATTISVSRAGQEHGERMRNARTNDFGALRVCCNVLHPWEATVKID